MCIEYKKGKGIFFFTKIGTFLESKFKNKIKLVHNLFKIN